MEKYLFRNDPYTYIVSCSLEKIVQTQEKGSIFCQYLHPSKQLFKDVDWEVTWEVTKITLHDVTFSSSLTWVKPKCEVFLLKLLTSRWPALLNHVTLKIFKRTKRLTFLAVSKLCFFFFFVGVITRCSRQDVSFFFFFFPRADQPTHLM